MLINILKFVVVLVCMTGLAVLMGMRLAKTFTGTRHVLPERWIYRLLGINPEEDMNWVRCGKRWCC